MSQLIHVSPPSTIKTLHDRLDEFKTDLMTGLSQCPKQIESKYFYDKRGSQLFNRITKHPDYYLTQSELIILDAAKKNLLDKLKKDRINLIELGPGEGVKTELLLNFFIERQLPCTYVPIDISEQYLKKVIKKLESHRVSLPITALHADYLQGLKWLMPDSNTRNLVLFLGSSIGNFHHVQAQDFFIQMRKNLHDNDYVLIGFDLYKDIDILMRAYDDSEGITRAFNLNLLDRINRELHADFDLRQFKHQALYNQEIGAMESYLKSLTRQVVNIKSIEKSFEFTTNEMLHVEYSYKYSVEQIEGFAQKARFKLVENYMDPQGYFVDSLWCAI